MAQFSVVYRLLLRSVATRGRIAAMVVLGLVGVLVAVAVLLADVTDPVRSATRFVDAFGLSLFAPVVTLVFSAATLGDPNDDGSLVHVWLRPVRRTTIALAGWLASLTISLPLALVPVVVAAAVASGGDLDVVTGSAAAVGLGVLAYSALFTLLGLRTRRSLVWGLAYILLWEGFVASAGRNAARLALRAYTRSVLERATGVELRLATVSPWFSVAVPVAVAVVAVVLTIGRLRRMEVT